MKKGRRLFDFIGIFVCLTAAWVTWDTAADKRAGNALFDAPAAEILTTYRGAGHGGSSVLEYGSDGTAKYSVKSLCGNEAILLLEAAADTTLAFEGAVETGQARVLLENAAQSEILEFTLDENAREIDLPKGRYTLLMIGRDFRGGFSFSGEGIAISSAEG